MDADHFDAFVRALPRRAALGGLSGGALFAFLASPAPILASKKKNRRKRKKQRQKKRKKRCPKRCTTGLTCGGGTQQCGTECIRDDACCGGCGDQQCCNGVCADCCGEGQSICDGTCTNLETDGAHCGACNNACTSGACIHGACTCPDGIAQCPAGCGCVSRIGGNVCAADVDSGPSCTVDDDCPLGSVCVEVGGGAFICTDPCLP